MKQADVVIGGVYVVRWHDGSFTQVRIMGTRPAYSINGRVRRVAYNAVNLSTGRMVVIKAASKLRERVA